MTTFLSVFLLVVGTASALTAFGGKTDGPEPLIKRITPRGWISLICLALALFAGAFKELYSRADDQRKEAEASKKAEQDKHEADARQADLKADLKSAQDKILLTNAQLELANTKLKLAAKELTTVKEQITGGSGFPVALIMALAPDTDGSFPLWVIPHGDAPLFDVSFKVIEGEPKPPTPEEMQKIQADAFKFLTGHTGDNSQQIGVLEARVIVPLGGYRIRPSTTDVSAYRISFRARNGSVLEMMHVRFNTTEHIWQYRYEIRSENPNTPNKLLVNEDWQPKHFLPMLHGNGPPHNK